jgi:hypothetical protein
MDSVGLKHVTRDTVDELCLRITTSWPRTRRGIPSQTGAKRPQDGDGAAAASASVSASNKRVLVLGAGTASSGAAATGDGAFSSELLADVLCAALHTKIAMKDLVEAVKAKSEVFKSVQLTSKADGGTYSNIEIAKSIAEFKPDQVTDAEGLLSWLIKVRAVVLHRLGSR